MTISTNDLRNEYTATSGQTVFTYSFKIFSASELDIYQTPAGNNFDDVADVVTGATVTGVGEEGGGTIILPAGAADGDRVTIVSDINESRTIDYQTSGDFSEINVNSDFDRAVNIAKQATSQSRRGLLPPRSEQSAGALTIPSSSERANKVLSFNSSGLPTVSTKTLAEIEGAVDSVNSGQGVDITVTADYKTSFSTDTNSMAGAVTAGLISVGTVVKTKGASTEGDGGGGDWFCESTGTALPGAAVVLVNVGYDIYTHENKIYLPDATNYTVFSNVSEVKTPEQFGGLDKVMSSSIENIELKLGFKTYNIVSVGTVQKDGFRVIGSGMPEYNSAYTEMTDGSGTILQGVYEVEGDNNHIENLGIDCGTNVIDNLNSGTHLEGLRMSITPSDRGNYATYLKNFTFDNIRVLLKPSDAGDSATWTHGLLIQGVININHGYIELHGGYHGYVIKAVDVQGGDVKVKATLGSSYIIKSDSLTRCQDIQVNSISVGSDSYSTFTDGAGILEAASGFPLENVQIGKLSGVNCNTLIDRRSTGGIENIQIGQYSHIGGGSGRSIKGIDGACSHFKIGTHFIKSVSVGIETTGGTDIDIGTGTVENASGNGYILQGDIRHGRLNPISCGGWGVENNGAQDLNPEMVFGQSNTSGDIDVLTVFTGNITFTTGWAQGTDYSVREWGNTFRLRGQVNNTGVGGGASPDTVLTVDSSKRPLIDRRGTVAAWDGTTNSVLPWFMDASTGVLTVYGAGALTTSGWVNLGGIEWNLLEQ